jgi:hypothetical protein
LRINRHSRSVRGRLRANGAVGNRHGPFQMEQAPWAHQPRCPDCLGPRIYGTFRQNKGRSLGLGGDLVRGS